MCVCVRVDPVTQVYTFIPVSQVFEELLWAGTRRGVSYYDATTTQASHVNSEVARCCVELWRSVLLDHNIDSDATLPSSAPDMLPPKVFEQLVEFRRNLDLIEVANHEEGDVMGG